MRSTTILILMAHVLLYASVFLDIPILRQFIGFAYLTFLPGFVILGVLGRRANLAAATFFLSVSLSIAFVMFTGLFVSTICPFLGISAPLSSLPLTVTISALTLALFIFGQRKEIGNDLNIDRSVDRINVEGSIICAISVLLLIGSIVGSLFDIVFLMVFALAGIAAIFFTTIFLHGRIPPTYYTFVLFAVSLSLLFQTSLISMHVMGYDIFSEYSAFESVRAAAQWTPPGIASSYGTTSVLNSILSVTILPTIYSTVLNINGELIFKVIYPFIFGIVPIILYKIYETQSGKIVALFSAFFFIAEPINFYGLESLSLAREMIAYLFFSAAIFCLLNRDLDIKTKKVLVITFGAALAVSHYSVAFLFTFFIVFVFVAMRISGKKQTSIDLPLVLTLVAITFAWYMYAATPPLDQLIKVFHNVAAGFAQNFFSSQGRLDPGMAVLSPVSQTVTFSGLIHKVLIYVTEFFVVVGAVILAIKPKEFKFDQEFRWMGILAASLLLICLIVPNFASALNFSRFYRLSMVFLAPLFILGGLYFLGLFRRIWSPSFAASTKTILRDSRLFLVVIILVAFFLFRSGFVNCVTGDRPYSYSLDFGRMKTSTIFEVRTGLYSVYVPEQDVFGARWLALQRGSNSLVRAEYGLGVSILIDYANLSRENIDYITNGTEPQPGSYVYLRGLNVVEGVVTLPDGLYNLSDVFSSYANGDQIYSNGQSQIYIAP